MLVAQRTVVAEIAMAEAVHRDVDKWLRPVGKFM
jgi:hypothetical protein